MIRTTLLALLALAASTTSVSAAPCSGANPALVSAVVGGVTRAGGVNRYRLTVTVANRGARGQASNVLQSVDIYENGMKVDAKGVPPLKPGQSYSFDYQFERAHGAADGTTNFTFRLDMHQSTPPNSQDCDVSDDRYRLRV